MTGDTTEEFDCLVPDFRGMEDEADFWGGPDPTECKEDFQRLLARSTKDPPEAITVLLDAEVLQDLQCRAREQGMPATTLVRTWILERLKEQDRKTAGTP